MRWWVVWWHQGPGAPQLCFTFAVARLLAGSPGQVVQRLVNSGVVEERIDEFHESSFAVRLDRVALAPITKVIVEGLVVHMKADDSQADGSKLMALIRLCCAGWEPCDLPPEPSRHASPRQVLVSLPLAPVAYFKVLSEIDSIFLKCESIQIFHGASAAYYQALLAMSDLRSLADLGGEVCSKPAKFFQDLMSTGGADIEQDGDGEGGLAIAGDGLQAIADEDDAKYAYIPGNAAEMDELFGHLIDVERRSRTFLSGGMQLKVNYDRCTHASGRQRAFIQCPHHVSARCRRYVFCHHFASARDAAAWLFAWATQEPVAPDKVRHLQTEPGEELVSSIFDQLE